MNSLRLYAQYVSIHIKSALQYKVSFFLTVIGQFFISFSVFLGIYFMFQRFPSVKGYTYEEVILCFGIMLLEFSIAEMPCLHPMLPFEHWQELVGIPPIS